MQPEMMMMGAGRAVVSAGVTPLAAVPPGRAERAISPSDTMLPFRTICRRRRPTMPDVDAEAFDDSDTSPVTRATIEPLGAEVDDPASAAATITRITDDAPQF